MATCGLLDMAENLKRNALHSELSFCQHIPTIRQFEAPSQEECVFGRKLSLRLDAHDVAARELGQVQFVSVLEAVEDVRSTL